MNPLHFTISGPDDPCQDQKLPWRLCVYEWKDYHGGAAGTYSHVTTYKGPLEFRTLEEAAAKFSEFQNSKDSHEKV